MEASGKLNLEDILVFQKVIKYKSFKTAVDALGKDRNYLYRLFDRVKVFIGDPYLKKDWRISDPIPVEIRRLFQGYDRLLENAVCYPQISAGSLVGPVVLSYLHRYVKAEEIADRVMLVRTSNVARSLTAYECDLAFLHRLDEEDNRPLSTGGTDMASNDRGDPHDPTNMLGQVALGPWTTVVLSSAQSEAKEEEVWLASWELESSAYRITEQAAARSTAIREALDPSVIGRRKHRFGSYLQAIEALRRGVPVRMALPDILIPPDLHESAQIIHPAEGEEALGKLYVKFREEEESTRLTAFLNLENWKRLLTELRPAPQEKGEGQSASIKK
ncbi:MAG: hypothetical protein ACI8UO_003847 [Verrucomicrobiales bacterium]|jgi:hypothetical protein